MNSLQLSPGSSNKICPELKREGICKAATICAYKHDPKYLDKAVCLIDIRNEIVTLKAEMDIIKGLLLKQTQVTTSMIKSFQSIKK